MKRIIIAFYYEFKDYLIFIKTLFESYHYEVINYPLFQYAYDANDKLENYEEHFDNFIKEKQADIILWWFLDVPLDIFNHIKNNNRDKLFIMYNSDDPSNFNSETLAISLNFDMIFTSCSENIQKYKIYTGLDSVFFLPMGYDSHFFYPYGEKGEKGDEIYDCDISMILYGFYDYLPPKSHYINRRKLIADIIAYCKENNKNFKLYGTHTIKEYYPEYYYGDIEYFNQNKLFNQSKINICLHPYSNKELSLTDLEIKIMGSGGIMLIDKIKGVDKIFKDNINCFHLTDTYIDQIDKIIKKYDSSPEEINKIKQNAHESSTSFKWENWVGKIHTEISKHYFHPATYCELIDLDPNIYDQNSVENNGFSGTVNNDNLWAHWLSVGFNKKIICYDFVVPENFNIEGYRSQMANSNDKMTPKRIYFDWYVSGRKPEYLIIKNKRDSNIMGNVDSLNILMEDWFYLNTIFTKISSYDTHVKDEGIYQLEKFCNNNPGIKLDAALRLYLNLCL